MPELFTSAQFWIGLGQIILVNIILSGDNAVVIALAARSLPERQRQQAIVWGSVAAIVMRVILTLVAVQMLKWPMLKFAGSLLLFWIALQLLLPEKDGGHGGTRPEASLMGTIRTILLADLVMSLDNVIAVAAAAKGSLALLIIGLGISIPLVVFGSTLILKLMDRYPVIVTVGAALLGFVSGEMLVTDPALEAWFEAHALLHNGIPLAAAAAVVLIGKRMAGQAAAVAAPAGVVDLANLPQEPATPALNQENSDA
jgi:YjbE family integral membrane protein